MGDRDTDGYHCGMGVGADLAGKDYLRLRKCIGRYLTEGREKILRHSNTFTQTLKAESCGSILRLMDAAAGAGALRSAGGW